MVFVTKAGFWFLLSIVLISLLFVGSVRNDAWFSFTELDQLIPNNFDDDYKAEVFFCPEDNCSTELISHIDSANEEIVIAIYSFTLDNVSDALARARERGVSVRVVFDKLQASNQYSVDEKLIEMGVATKIKEGSGYMHNKFTVIDRKKVLTGSFNYSKNGDTKNDENLVLIISKKIAEQYVAEFEELWEEVSE